MASATLAALQAHLQLKYGGTVTHQFRKHYPALRVIPKVSSRVRPSDGGPNYPVEFKRGDSAGSSFHTPGGDFPTAGSVLRASARYNWSELAQRFGVDDLAAGISRSNRLPSAGTVMSSEGASAIVSMMDDAETSFYTGDFTASPPQLAGITAAGGTATYAGINPATSGYEKWQGKNNTGTLATFNDDPQAVLRERIITPIRDEGGSADFAFCRSGLIDKILNAQNGADANTRIRLYGGESIPVLSLGARAAVVDSTWFIEDPSAPENKIAVVSTEDVEIQYVDQSADMDFEAMAAAMAQFGVNLHPSVVEQIMTGPLALPPVYFVEIGRTATKQEIGVATQLQVVWKRRNTHGLLTLS